MASLRFNLGLSISLIACLISSLTNRLIPSSTDSSASKQNDMDQSSLPPGSPFIFKQPEPPHTINAYQGGILQTWLRHTPPFHDHKRFLTSFPGIF
jgi:hypothetical protein